MVKEKEDICLKAVNKVLSAEFDPNSFSTKGSKESAACIEKKAQAWEVYGYERGNKFQVSVFRNVVDACLELIRRIGMNRNLDDLIDQFYSEIIGKSVA